jgi:sugar lactone lactonase YvrE
LALSATSWLNKFDRSLFMEVEIIADEACRCGEGPIWHAAEKRLYWQDSTTGRLFRYDPASQSHEQVLKTDYIGATTVQADGSMLVFGSGCGVWRLRDGQLTVLCEPMPGESRFNDVAADPAGRVFAGSMPIDAPDNTGTPGKHKRLGRLYLFDTDLSCRVVEEDLGCANGIGFSPDHNTMYYVDSLAHAIHAYTYDIGTGDITGRRTFAPIDAPPLPDGLTVDAQGCVWLALWDGGCVRRYSPDGELMQTVTLPTPLTTSLMFGGEALDELFVTSAGGDNKDTKGQDAGALFRLRPGVTGRPENLSRLGLT